MWEDARMLDPRHLALMDSNRRRLVRARTRLLGPADAEDAEQDAYVRALKGQTTGSNSTPPRHAALAGGFPCPSAPLKKMQGSDG